MRQVGARELKQHTGAVIAHLRRGERLLLTHRGSPIAIIAPIDPDALADLLERAAVRAETVSWLQASERAFAFWDSPEDEVWDRVAVEPPG
jgi:antitoxin (DNA-binding transcriptional repressor) of toxin-antitoxin stability system